MAENILSFIAPLLTGNIVISFVLAFVSGVVASFTPCSLSTIPLVIGCVGGAGVKGTRKAFLLSVIFCAGNTVIFIILGVAAALAGKLMGFSPQVWYMLMGTLMVLMALQMWEIYNFVPASTFGSRNSLRGCAGAFAAGVLGGLFASACSTPVLVAIMAFVSQQRDIFRGVLLMAAYSAGHSVIVVAAGTSVNFVKKLKSDGRYRALSQVLKIFTGLAILVLGLYMFYLAF